MKLKQMAVEEGLAKLTRKNRNENLHSEQNKAIPHFFQQCEKQWMQFK